MRINHIALYCLDLEGMKEFFIRYFGATSNDGYHNPRTDFRSYMLSFEDGARVELMTRPAMQDEQKSAFRTGYAHISISVGSKEAVDALTDTLRRDGYTVADGPRTTGDGYYESSIVAFENNVIEITV